MGTEKTKIRVVLDNSVELGRTPWEYTVTTGFLTAEMRNHVNKDNFEHTISRHIVVDIPLRRRTKPLVFAYIF